MQLPRPRFQVRPQGYAFTEVDTLVNQVNAALAANEHVPPDVVDRPSFTLATNSGYDVDDVDTWFDDAFEVVCSPDPRPFPSASSPGQAQGFDLPEDGAAAGRQAIAEESFEVYSSDQISPNQTGTDQTRAEPPQTWTTKPLPDNAGYTPIQELPATPRWVSVLTLLVFVALVGGTIWYFVAG